MKPDDFEKQLQRQPVRPVPGAWREDILRAAQTASPKTGERSRGVFVRAGLKLWRELVWPSRHAWSGMAALWLILWAVNSRLADAPRPMMVTAAGAAGRIQSFEEQRRVLVELTGPIEPPPAAPSPRRRSQPRSERALVVRVG